MLISRILLKFFHLNIVPMILYKERMPFRLAHDQWPKMSYWGGGGGGGGEREKQAEQAMEGCRERETFRRPAHN